MLATEDFEPDLSPVDKLNLEAARFNFGMTRLSDVVEAARFKAETDDDFFSPEVEMSDKSLFSRLMIKKGLNFALLKSKETIWFQDTAHCLRINYYVQKIGGRRSQWNSDQMNNRHPWQLKKSKSWGAVLELPAKQHCQFSPFGPFSR